MLSWKTYWKKFTFQFQIRTHNQKVLMKIRLHQNYLRSLRNARYLTTSENLFKIMKYKTPITFIHIMVLVWTTMYLLYKSISIKPNLKNLQLTRKPVEKNKKMPHKLIKTKRKQQQLIAYKEKSNNNLRLPVIANNQLKITR